MSKGLVASGLNFLARLGKVLLLAAVVPEKHLVDVREVQPRRGPAIIGADLDRQPAEHLDAVAGSEFVDDRIRLVE